MELDEKLEIEAKDGGVWLSVSRQTAPDAPLRKFEGLFGPASFKGIFSPEEFQDTCRSLFEAGIFGKNPRVKYQAIVREHQIELLIKLDVFDGHWRIFNFKLTSDKDEKGSTRSHTDVALNDVESPAGSYGQTEPLGDEGALDQHAALPEVGAPESTILKTPYGPVSYNRASTGSIGSPNDLVHKCPVPVRQRSTQDLPSYSTANVGKIGAPRTLARPATAPTGYNQANVTKITIPHTFPGRRRHSINIPLVKSQMMKRDVKRTLKLVAETKFIPRTTRCANVSSEDVTSPAPTSRNRLAKEEPASHYSLMSPTEVDSPVYRPRGYVGSMVNREDIGKELEKHGDGGANYYLLRDSWSRGTLIDGSPDPNLFVISYLRDRKKLKHHRIYRRGQYFAGEKHGEREKVKTIEEYLKAYVKAAKYPIPGFN